MRNIKTDVVHDAFFQYVSLFGTYLTPRLDVSLLTAYSHPCGGSKTNAPNQLTSRFGAFFLTLLPTISQEKYLEKKSILNQPGSSSKIEN